MDNSPARPPASSTAHWIAAARARESERSDALFHDPYAAILAGDVGRASLAASERASGGENLFLAVRALFFDEALIAEARADDAVVLLGAGLDTRAFRLPLPPDIDWYEIDDGALLANKERVLDELGASSSCRTRQPVAADLGGPWARRCWTRVSWPVGGRSGWRRACSSTSRRRSWGPSSPRRAAFLVQEASSWRMSAAPGSIACR